MLEGVVQQPRRGGTRLQPLVLVLTRPLAAERVLEAGVQSLFAVRGEPDADVVVPGPVRLEVATCTLLGVAGILQASLNGAGILGEQFALRLFEPLGRVVLGAVCLREIGCDCGVGTLGAGHGEALLRQPPGAFGVVDLSGEPGLVKPSLAEGVRGPASRGLALFELRLALSQLLLRGQDDSLRLLEVRGHGRRVGSRGRVVRDSPVEPRDLAAQHLGCEVPQVLLDGVGGGVALSLGVLAPLCCPSCFGEVGDARGLAQAPQVHACLVEFDGEVMGALAGFHGHGGRVRDGQLRGGADVAMMGLAGRQRPLGTVDAQRNRPQRRGGDG